MDLGGKLTSVGGHLDKEWHELLNVKQSKLEVKSHHKREARGMKRSSERPKSRS